MRLMTVVLCLLLLPMTAAAQNDSFRKEHSIESKFPAEKRTFTVQLPASYYRSKHRFPLLLLLDGESNLAYSEAVSSFLAENALIPEVIVVAPHAGAARMRDYLPAAASASQLSGKADQFLDYIEKELLPFVEGNYRAAPFRVISGHSAGGVLALHALIEKPQLFQAYLTQSPYLTAPLAGPLLERMESFLTQSRDTKGFLYMNLGDEPNLEANFNKLKDLLKAKAPASLRWQAERAAGKTHMTTRLVGHYAGLEHYFAQDWVLSQTQIASGKASGFKRHLAGLSEKYGYPVLYSEQGLAQATQIFLQQRDMASGTEIAELYVAQYPSSPLAYFLLTSVYGSSGKRDAAAQSIAKAIQLYEADPQPKLKALYAQMKQVNRQLNPH